MMFFPFLISIIATTKLIIDAPTENNIPTFKLSNVLGCINLNIADQIMLTAAIIIKAPSIVLEKYSALVCPKLWLLSAGLAEIINIINATIAPIKLTIDSNASE